jgi:hypothetical protein
MAAISAAYRARPITQQHSATTSSSRRGQPASASPPASTASDWVATTASSQLPLAAHQGGVWPRARTATGTATTSTSQASAPTVHRANPIPSRPAITARTPSTPAAATKAKKSGAAAGLFSSSRTDLVARTNRAPLRMSSTTQAAPATVANAADSTPRSSSCVAIETIPVAMTMPKEPGGRRAIRRETTVAGRGRASRPHGAWSPPDLPSCSPTSRRQRRAQGYDSHAGGPRPLGTARWCHASPPCAGRGGGRLRHRRPVKMIRHHRATELVDRAVADGLVERHHDRPTPVRSGFAHRGRGPAAVPGWPRCTRRNATCSRVGSKRCRTGATGLSPPGLSTRSTKPLQSAPTIHLDPAPPGQMDGWPNRHGATPAAPCPSELTAAGWDPWAGRARRACAGPGQPSARGGASTPCRQPPRRRTRRRLPFLPPTTGGYIVIRYTTLAWLSWRCCIAWTQGHAEASTSGRITAPWPARRTRRPPAGSPARQRPARSVRGERSAPTHAQR